MPEQQGGFERFMRGLGNVAVRTGRAIGQHIRHSPIGELATGHPINAAMATPAGRLVRYIMASGGPQATRLGAYGPTAGNYSGLPQTPGQSIPNDFSGTDWGQFIAPDPNMGPPQYSPPMRDPSLDRRYGANGNTWANIGVFGGQGTSPGVGRNSFLTPYSAPTTLNMNPAGWKQSGIQFVDQNQAF